MSTRGAELRGTRLQEQLDIFLHCNLNRHGSSWERIPETADDANWLKKWNGAGVVRWLWRCTNCRTRKLELITRATGDIFKRDYDYPEGYALAQIDGRRPRSNTMRVELIGRERRAARTPAKKARSRKVA